MTKEPSPSGDNGRDTRGRFTAGNRAATGNPHAKHVGRLRTALLAAVTDEDIRDVVAALIAQAKSGDVAAVRELLLRTIGKPVEHDLLERIEAIENALASRASA